MVELQHKHSKGSKGHVGAEVTELVIILLNECVITLCP